MKITNGVHNGIYTICQCYYCQGGFSELVQPKISATNNWMHHDTTNYASESKYTEFKNWRIL